MATTRKRTAATEADANEAAASLPIPEPAGPPATEQSDWEERYKAAKERTSAATGDELLAALEVQATVANGRKHSSAIRMQALAAKAMEEHRQYVLDEVEDTTAASTERKRRHTADLAARQRKAKQLRDEAEAADAEADVAEEELDKVKGKGKGKR